MTRIDGQLNQWKARVSLGECMSEASERHIGSVFYSSIFRCFFEPVNFFGWWIIIIIQNMKCNMCCESNESITEFIIWW